MPITWRWEWTEIAAIVAVSYVLYQLNVFLLFLIPVQLLYARRGDRAVTRGAAIIFAATAMTALVRLGVIEDANLKRTMILLEVAIPFAMLAGVVLTDLRWPSAFNPGRFIKLGLVTAAIGLMSIPIAAVTMRSEGLTDFFLLQIETIRSSLQSSMDADPAIGNVFADLLSDPERLAELSSDVFLRTFMFGFYLLIAGSIWVGDFAAAKTTGGDYSRLSRFHVPIRGVWYFTVPWAVILLDIAVGIGSIRYVFWNAGLMMLFAYGVQGFGIVRHWLVRRGTPAWMRVVFAIGIVLMLFWPVVNLLVIIGFPGLGISETWVRYRKPDKEL